MWIKQMILMLLCVVEDHSTNTMGSKNPERIYFMYILRKVSGQRYRYTNRWIMKWLAVWWKNNVCVVTSEVFMAYIIYTDEVYNDWTSVIEQRWSWWSWLVSASEWTACCLILKCRATLEDPLQVWCCQWSVVQFVPLRMARSGAIALWCQTVMSRVQGNTINTMARISLLFGISRIGCSARHYLGEENTWHITHRFI